MNLTIQEKSILNTVFKGVKGTTRNKLLMTLYAAKPLDDGSNDANTIINILNVLIEKLAALEQAELEKVFNDIPYDL